MSRIQQILAKAERDGTARRIGSRDDTAVAEPPHAAPPVMGRDELEYSERTPYSRTQALPPRAVVGD